jgi:NAD(P)-dependent dehydrogenase (short-subunit alcohol dehydrogenase family)
MAETRVALVTGGANGIGRSVAARLARDGWRVVVADRQEARPDHPARCVEADVSDEAAVSALLDGVRREEGRLDALVSNAGFMVRKSLRDLALAEWNAVLGTNLTGTFLLVRAAEAMLRAAGGAVVTVASTRARQSEPDTESYAASKGGLVALTHALAVSLGPDVRVNCISPGWIETKARRCGRRTTRSTRRAASAGRRTWRRSPLGCSGRRAASSRARSSSSTAA